MKCEKCKKKITEKEVAGGNHFWSRYYCKKCWETVKDKLTLRYARRNELIEDPAPPTW